MVHALANTPEIKDLKAISLVVKHVDLEPDSLAGGGSGYTPSLVSLSHNKITHMVELSTWHIVSSFKM